MWHGFGRACRAPRRSGQSSMQRMLIKASRPISELLHTSFHANVAPVPNRSAQETRGPKPIARAAVCCVCAGLAENVPAPTTIEYLNEAWFRTSLLSSHRNAALFDVGASLQFPELRIAQSGVVQAQLHDFLFNRLLGCQGKGPSAP